MKGKQVASWFYTLVPVVVRAVFSLLINKWIAVFYGPVGISLLAQFQNAFSIAQSIPADSSGRLLVRELSVINAVENLDQEEQTEAKKWWQITLIFNTLIVLLMSVSFIGVFANSESYRAWEKVSFIFIAGLVSVAFSYAQQHLQYLQAKRNLLTYAQWNIISVGISGVLVLLCFQWQLMPLLWIFLAWMSLQSFILWVGVRKWIPKSFLASIQFSALPWKQLLSFVAATASIALLGKLSDFAVRTYAIQRIGEEETGIYQALVRLGEIYFVPLNALLGVLFFPAIAALEAKDEWAFRKRQQLLLSNWLLGIGALTAIGLLILYFFAEPIILFLNSASFMPAAEVLPYQLVGELFKVLTYIMATYALAKGLLKYTIVSEVLSVGVYFALIAFYHQEFSAKYWAIIHSLRYVAYFVIWLILLFITDRQNEKPSKAVK